MNIRLHEIADEVRDLYVSNKEDDLPYIGLEHVEQGTLHISHVGSSREVESYKLRFRAGDILFGTLRPYFRKVIIAPYEGVCSTEFCVVRPKEPNDRHFVFYGMAHAQFIQYATVNSNGARPRTKWKLFSDFEFPQLPPPQRRKIGDILSAYDDLIENNRRRIRLLEQAARLLYKEWFVHMRFPGHEHATIEDGVPEGWERRTLGDIVDIKRGKNITKDSVMEGPVPVVAGGLSPAYYHNTANASGPVITVSASGANAGYVNIYHEDIWVSDCSYISRVSTECLYYLYLLLTSKQKEIFGFQKGVAQPHVYPNDLKRLQLLDPNDSLVRLFEETVMYNFQQVEILQKQSKLLSKARDILLPRLMKGEVTL